MGRLAVQLVGWLAVVLVVFLPSLLSVCVVGLVVSSVDCSVGWSPLSCWAD